jgi:transposase
VGIKRKQHSAEFKARVAMTALSGEKTLAELSAEFGVHPTMISGWKQELVTRAGELFAGSNKAAAVEDVQRVIDAQLAHQEARLQQQFRQAADDAVGQDRAVAG